MNSDQVRRVPHNHHPALDPPSPFPRSCRHNSLQFLRMCMPCKSCDSNFTGLASCGIDRSLHNFFCVVLNYGLCPNLCVYLLHGLLQAHVVPAPPHPVRSGPASLCTQLYHFSHNNHKIFTPPVGGHWSPS